MRFALPVTLAVELEPLVSAGAGEFYCGFMEREWSERWGNHDSISRRQGAANVTNLDELRRIAQESVRLKTPTYLALNGCYSQPQIGYLTELAQDWATWEGSGLIVRDLALLEHLKMLALPLRVTLSLLAVVINSQAAHFFARKGVDRIVLPRFLSIRDMAEMIAAAPDLEYEAMVMDDGCPFVDGFCRAIHGCGYLPRSGDEPAQVSIPTWDVSGSAHHLCIEMGRSTAESPACAACTLPLLEKAGVAVGKFGGRGTSLQSRLDKLSFLREAQRLHGDDARSALYQQSFGSCNCYYDESIAPRRDR